MIGQVAAGLGSGYAHLDINGPVRGWEHDGAERQDRLGVGGRDSGGSADLGVVVGHMAMVVVIHVGVMLLG